MSLTTKPQCPVQRLNLTDAEVRAGRHLPRDRDQRLRVSLGEPDPLNDPRDEQLEHRMIVPTPAMIAICKWWHPARGACAICFKNPDQRPVVWRMAGDREWQYTDCPQPLKPHGMTWKTMDARLASATAPAPERDYSGLIVGLVVFWLFIVCIYSVSWLAKDFVNAAGRQRSEVGVPARTAPIRASALSYPQTAHR